MTNVSTKWYCEVCNAGFQRKLALENHFKTLRHCKNVLEKHSDGDELIELKKRNEELMLEVQRLTDEVTKLKQLKKTRTNSYNNNACHYENCNFTNVQVNLSLNPYGNENWNYLKDDVLNIMKGVNTCAYQKW